MVNGKAPLKSSKKSIENAKFYENLFILMSNRQGLKMHRFHGNH